MRRGREKCHGYVLASIQSTMINTEFYLRPKEYTKVILSVMTVRLICRNVGTWFVQCAGARSATDVPNRTGITGIVKNAGKKEENKCVINANVAMFQTWGLAQRLNVV